MLLRLLITAAIVLAIAKYYLHDNKANTEQAIKPKAQIEQVQQQLDSFSKKGEEQNQKALKELGL